MSKSTDIAALFDQYVMHTYAPAATLTSGSGCKVRDPDGMTYLDFPRSRQTALAVVIPISLMGVALALWWISDKLMTVGPFDRAAFGWVFVVPIWLAHLSPASNPPLC